MAENTPKSYSNQNDDFFKTAQFFNPPKSEESNISEQISTNQSDQKLYDNNNLIPTFKDLPNSNFDLEINNNQKINNINDNIIEKQQNNKYLNNLKSPSNINIKQNLQNNKNTSNNNNISNNNLQLGKNKVQIKIKSPNQIKAPLSIRSPVGDNNIINNINTNKVNVIDDIFGDSNSQQEDKQFWEKVEKIMKQSKSNISTNSASTNNTSINNNSRNQQQLNKQIYQQQLYQYTNNNNNNILSNLDNSISLPPIKQKKNHNEEELTSRNNTQLKRPQMLLKQQQSENTYQMRPKNPSSILNQYPSKGISQYSKKQSVPNMNLRPYSNSENYYADSNEFMQETPFQNKLRVLTAQETQNNMDLETIVPGTAQNQQHSKFGRPKTQLLPYSSKNRTKKENSINDMLNYNIGSLKQQQQQRQQQLLQLNHNKSLYDTLQSQQQSQQQQHNQSHQSFLGQIDDIQQASQQNNDLPKNRNQLKNIKSQQKINQYQQLKNNNNNNNINNNNNQNNNQQQEYSENEFIQPSHYKHNSVQTNPINQPNMQICKTQSSQQDLESQKDYQISFNNIDQQKKYPQQLNINNNINQKKVTIKFKSQENVVRKLFNKDFKIAKSKQSLQVINNSNNNVANSQENPFTHKPLSTLQRQQSENIMYNTKQSQQE